MITDGFPYVRVYFSCNVFDSEEIGKWIRSFRTLQFFFPRLSIRMISSSLSSLTRLMTCHKHRVLRAVERFFTDTLLNYLILRHPHDLQSLKLP